MPKIIPVGPLAPTEFAKAQNYARRMEADKNLPPKKLLSEAHLIKFDRIGQTSRAMVIDRMIPILLQDPDQNEDEVTAVDPPSGVDADFSAPYSNYEYSGAYLLKVYGEFTQSRGFVNGANGSAYQSTTGFAGRNFSALLVVTGSFRGTRTEGVVDADGGYYSVATTNFSESTTTVRVRQRIVNAEGETRFIEYSFVKDFATSMSTTSRVMYAGAPDTAQSSYELSTSSGFSSEMEHYASATGLTFVLSKSTYSTSTTGAPIAGFVILGPAVTESSSSESVTAITNGTDIGAPPAAHFYPSVDEDVNGLWMPDPIPLADSAAKGKIIVDGTGIFVIANEEIKFYAAETGDESTFPTGFSEGWEWGDAYLFFSDRKKKTYVTYSGDTYHLDGEALARGEWTAKPFKYPAIDAEGEVRDGYGPTSDTP